MKWLSIILTTLALGQSALAADYAMVDTTQEGTAHLLVATNGRFRPLNAGQLLYFMQMDPFAKTLLQGTSMRMLQNNYYRQISTTSLPSLPRSTPVSVSTSDSKSHKIEDLAMRYNKVAKTEETKKPTPPTASKNSSEQSYSNANLSFAEALKSCSKEMQKFKSAMGEGSAASHWMFLRRRLELVTPECKAAVIAAGGVDLNTNQNAEIRPGEIKGERSFNLKTYGSAK